jgi:hypothetical protein
MVRCQGLEQSVHLSGFTHVTCSDEYLCIFLACPVDQCVQFGIRALITPAPRDEDDVSCAQLDQPTCESPSQASSTAGDDIGTL